MESLGLRSVAVVGGGIIGLATAVRLGEAYSDAAATVLEKEYAPGRAPQRRLHVSL